MDARIEAIQLLAPLGLTAVAEELQSSHGVGEPPVSTQGLGSARTVVGGLSGGRLFWVTRRCP